MKYIKRFLGALMVLAMALTFTTSAFATNLEIQDTSENKKSTYRVYRILDAEQVDGKGTEGTEDDKYVYKVPLKYSTALKNVYIMVEGSEPKDDAALLDLIAGLKGNEASYDMGSTVRTFADEMYAQITAASLTPDAEKTNDGEEYVYITDVEPGYYLVTETVSSAETGAVTSMVMLDTVGAHYKVSIKSKEDAPSLIKKVHDVNDTEGESQHDKHADAYWQDSADHDIGDLVDYKLEATLGDISAFDEHYYLAFHDTMSKGLTFAGEDKVKVYLQKKSGGEPVQIPSGYSVTTDNKSEKYPDGTSWTLEFMDLKEVVAALGHTLEKGDKIVAIYQAMLNEKAELGYPGNPNVAYLEYSNNPYSQGDGSKRPDDTGKTPEDKCIVFTFAAQVNKVDGNKKPLKGAGFTLYKQVPEIPEDGDGEYITLTEESDRTAADGETGEAGEGGETPTPAQKTYWKKIKEINLPEGTEFKFEGLDDGNYMLRETTVPMGYYAIEDLFFAIAAEHDELSDDPLLKNLTVQALGDTGNWKHSIDKDDDIFSVDLQDGIISTTIMNVTGARLPSTGGIGTTVFYVAGGVLVLGAAVLLVLKKRNGAGK